MAAVEGCITLLCEVDGLVPCKIVDPRDLDSDVDGDLSKANESDEI